MNIMGLVTRGYLGVGRETGIQLDAGPAILGIEEVAPDIRMSSARAASGPVITRSDDPRPGGKATSVIAPPGPSAPQITGSTSPTPTIKK